MDSDNYSANTAEGIGKKRAQLEAEKFKAGYFSILSNWKNLTIIIFQVHNAKV